MQSSQQTNKSQFIFRATGRQRLIAVIVLAILSVFFGSFALASHFNLDMGNYLGRCGFKTMYHLPCPTCGYTTATLAYTKGKIFEAFYIQPACGLFCSIFVIIGVISLIIALFGINFSFVVKILTEVKIRYAIFALIIIVASGWAVTLARAWAAH